MQPEHKAIAGSGAGVQAKKTLKEQFTHVA